MKELIDSISIENILWGIGSFAAIYFLIKERVPSKNPKHSSKKTVSKAN